MGIELLLNDAFHTFIEIVCTGYLPKLSLDQEGDYTHTAAAKSSIA
jgi:hypothetical protein